ncbi:glycosyltransferase family 2 protein [Butyrivibrio sp. AE3004]|uniref:glycosyltransferase family 2 protein n=1 Tax=Butyrivibrio sp. AE3004 TaxID=1506994 RepID=UPI00068C9A8C|nr:glycosyltransferase family 2 protein [Butyrivibrio sp. AE3004]
MIKRMIKEMNGLVSVIVPMHNVEKYINKSIKSIVDQSYRNLEIILINDCSTDNTGVICQEWAKKDKRILYLCNNNNLGVQDTRNKALDVCNGDFIAFVDSDDFVHELFIERLLCTLVEQDADVVLCHEIAFQDGCDEEKIVLKIEDKGTIIIENHDEYIEHFMDDFTGPIGWSWNKLFKAAVINTTRYKKYIYEDLVFNAEVSKSINKAVWLNDRSYAYRLRDGSITSKGNKDINNEAAESFLYTLKVLENSNADYSNRLRLYTLVKIANLCAKSKKQFGKESEQKIRKTYNKAYDELIKKIKGECNFDMIKIFLARYCFTVYYQLVNK